MHEDKELHWNEDIETKVNTHPPSLFVILDTVKTLSYI